jgi:hypothetical protein
LCIDRGGEFLSTKFNQFCHQAGIQWELIQALTPQQNGVSERRNCTIIEQARSVMDECELPNCLWSEVVHTANYLINWSPTCANLSITPHKLYTGIVPDVSHLKNFGSLIFVHIPKTDRKKLDWKTRCYLFLGYDDESKVYRLFDLARKRIILSRDVICDEIKIGYNHIPNLGSPVDDPFLSSYPGSSVLYPGLEDEHLPEGNKLSPSAPSSAIETLLHDSFPHSDHFLSPQQR